MADWRDGAEYAPTVPPIGFAAPPVPPLTATADRDGSVLPEESGQQLVPGPGGQLTVLPPPDAILPPTQPGPALSQVAPARQESRDPRVPFSVGAASFGGLSGLHDPRQPFVVARPAPLEVAELEAASSAGEPSLNFPPPTGIPVAPSAPVYPAPSAPTPPEGGPWPSPPAPGTPLVGPRPWEAPPAPPSEEIGLWEVLRRVGWPLLGCLVVGVALRPLTLAALLVAWMFSMNVRVGGLAVRRAFGAAIGGVSMVLVVAIMLQYFDPLSAATTAARWACGLLLFICPLLVWRASQNTR